MTSRLLSPQMLEGYYLRQIKTNQQTDYTLPEVLVLDLADLVNSFQNEWNAILFQNRHDQSFGSKLNWERVLQQVIDAVQQENDAELELASMAYNDIASLLTVNFNEDESFEVDRYSILHIELANATVKFGKEVIRRFRKEAIYHHGSFPYNFKCLVGSTIAVQHVEKALTALTLPDGKIRKGDNFHVSCESSTASFSDLGSHQ